MPDAQGYMTDAEIDAMADKWSLAPSLAEFPPEETERIKADDNTLGWLESPYGEVYLDRACQFFSPITPYHSDMLNAMFRGQPLRYVPAYGDPIHYYLSTAAGWAKCPYHVKPDMFPEAGTSGEIQPGEELIF